MKFYSEFGEDQWVSEHLSLPERGVYLDIGCGHPENGSNTAFLRDRGWLGLAVDANRDYAPHWIGRQQFYVGLFSSKPSVHFKFAQGNSAMSRILDGPLAHDPLHEVKQCSAVTLGYFLGCTFGSASPPIRDIDFMSLDIEGSEFDVFQTFDWSERWKPKILVAEYNTMGAQDFRLRDLLVGSGLYSVVHQTTANFIYLRQ